MRVLLHDRKSGNVYYGTCDYQEAVVIRLRDPVCRRRTSILVNIFQKGNWGTSYEFMEYGVACNDIILSIESVFIEIIPDHKNVGWVDVTEKKAEELLADIKKAIEAKNVEDEKMYYAGKSPLSIFFMKLFR